MVYVFMLSVTILSVFMLSVIAPAEGPTLTQLTNIRRGRKKIPGANTLAYFVSPSATKKICFIRLALGGFQGPSAGLVSQALAVLHQPEPNPPICSRKPPKKVFFKSDTIHKLYSFGDSIDLKE